MGTDSQAVEHENWGADSGGIDVEETTQMIQVQNNLWTDQLNYHPGPDPGL